MSISQILNTHIANVKVIGSILGTLTVLIAAIVAVEGRYAHATKMDKELEELQLAMDESDSQLKLDVQQLYLDMKVDRNEERISELQNKLLEKGMLDQWEEQRLHNLRRLHEQDERKLEQLEQFRLEHHL